MIMKRVLFLLLVVSLSVVGCKKEQKEPAKAPTVSTGAVSAVTTTSFDCEGNVTADGGAAVTDRGVCYAMSSAPTVSNDKVSGGQGTGSFKVSVSNLTPGKIYYARAYATNSVGTTYGQEVKVTLIKVVEGITVSPTEKSVEAGEKFKLQVTFTPADVPNKAVTFSSNKSDVASVDDKGEVTTHKEGIAIITATSVDGGKTATCKVTVRRKPVLVTGITVSPTAKSVKEGETFVITATVLPADADNKAVTWSSSASDIASVNDQGRVTTHKPGNATITATTVEGGKTATCQVTVNKKEVKVTGITVNPTKKTIIEGESFIIFATVLPADADNKTVIWSSSASDIASVNDQGRVTTHKPGKVVITATTEDGGKTATCEVTVKSKITDEYKELRDKAKQIEQNIESARTEFDSIKKSDKTVNEKLKLLTPLLEKIGNLQNEISTLSQAIEAKKDTLHEHEYKELKKLAEKLLWDCTELQAEVEIYKAKLEKAAREGKGNISDLEIVDL